MTAFMGQDAPRSEPATPVRPRSRRKLLTTHDIRQRRRRIRTYALLAFSFVLMVNALVGENGYLATLRARHDYETLADSLSRLKRENQQYREQVRQLKSDPNALEEAARRVLGFIRPGETLIIIRDARPSTPVQLPQ
jgi:cell division protein FtsB